MNLGTPKNFTKQNNHHPSSTIFGVVNQSPFLSRHDLIKHRIMPALTSASTGIVLSVKTTGSGYDGKEMDMFFEMDILMKADVAHFQLQVLTL